MGAGAAVSQRPRVPAAASRKNVLVLTSWPFRGGLIQAYTLPYLRMIRGCLPPDGTIRLVTREPSGGGGEKGRLAEAGIEWVPLGYRRFGVLALFQALGQVAALFRLCRAGRIDTIHCFGTPAGTLGCVLSRLTGAELVLDSYEPHAESMVENGTWSASGLAFGILSRFERWQSHRAAVVIGTTAGMRDYAKSRFGAELKRFYVKPACVDLERFKREDARDEEFRRAQGLEGKVVCVYAGKFGGIYLDEEVFDFLKVASDYWGGRFRALILTTDDEGSVLARCRRAGLDRAAVVCRSVEHKDMPRHLALADFALTPVKPVPTKRLCTPIKDGEYWAMGLPVVITPDISDDSEIIEKHGIGAVLRDFSQAGCLSAVRRIDELLNGRSRLELRAKIRAVAQAHRGYDKAAGIYREIYA